MAKFIATPLLAILVLATAACTSVPPEIQAEVAMATACDSFSDALRVATTFKGQMSPEQVASVDRAVDVAQPACHSFRENPDMATESLVNQVRDALRAIVLANQEVRS